MPASTVLILDPGNYTPYYDLNLAGALQERGWNVKWLTSRFLFESIELPEAIRSDYCFFKALENELIQHLSRSRERHRLRRAIKALAYPFDLLRLDRKLAAETPDLIHVQWALLPTLDAAFWTRWQRHGWKIVFTAHDVIGLRGTTPRILRDANRQLFRVADAVVAHSQVEREEIIAANVSPTRVRYIPQGGPGIFTGSPPTQSEARSGLGIKLHRPTILFFGLVKPYKGLNVLLQSFTLIQRKISDALLMIVGEPLMERKKYERLIAALNLTNNIRWIPLFIPSREVGKYFVAADVLAVPYLAASSSAVLLSAYAYSRPVVATNVGGLTEMVSPNHTGLLVPPDNPAALADALTELLRDPAKNAAMGKQAHQYLETNHSWSLIAERTAGLYDTLS